MVKVLAVVCIVCEFDREEREREKLFSGLSENLKFSFYDRKSVKIKFLFWIIILRGKARLDTSKSLRLSPLKL